MDQPVFDWERLFGTSDVDRETLLDLTVNVVPLLILGFFMVLFLVIGSWGFDPVLSAIQLGITGVTFLFLVIVTWVSGAVVSRDEAEEEERAAQAAGAADGDAADADAGH